jgi:hypothetical protein
MEKAIRIGLDAEARSFNPRGATSRRPEVESYDPVSNTWQQHPPLPTPKHGIWASVIGSTIHLLGGTAQGLGATTSHESFTVR